METKNWYLMERSPVVWNIGQCGVIEQVNNFGYWKSMVWDYKRSYINMKLRLWICESVGRKLMKIL